MGIDSDPFAVTDAAGCVRGIKGLRVVDASIMSTIASSNPNAVVMMMAERLSDTILGQRLLDREKQPFYNCL